MLFPFKFGWRKTKKPWALLSTHGFDCFCLFAVAVQRTPGGLVA
jgi:hypothetical protein